MVRGGRIPPLALGGPGKRPHHTRGHKDPVQSDLRRKHPGPRVWSRALTVLCPDCAPGSRSAGPGLSAEAGGERGVNSKAGLAPPRALLLPHSFLSVSPASWTNVTRVSEGTRLAG